MKITLIIILAFLTTSVFGQIKAAPDTDVKKFYDSFGTTIFLFGALKANFPARYTCNPLMCLLKINIDQNGHVSDMFVSDSADSAFKAEFNTKKSELDIAPIEAYAQSVAFKNKYLIIPIHFSYLKAPCLIAPISHHTLANYTKFNGEFLKGDTVFLELLAIQGGPASE